MHLSKHAKIVVIDNEFENEAKPLLDALNKEGIPYLYFDGDLASLPENPYVGIRFVFLDVELKGMEGKDAKTKASGVVGVLEQIISKENGPYAIIFWTKHPETIDQTLENCAQKGIKPLLYIDLDKSSCKDETGHYQLSVISKQIEEKASEFGPFSLYIAWENIVATSSSQIINGLAGIFPYDNNWSQKTEYLFYRMYKAYVEKNELGDNTEKIGCVLQLINRSFKDTIENNIAKARNEMKDFIVPVPPEEDQELISFINNVNSSVNVDIVAKMNNSLFIVDNPVSSLYSGGVFLEDDDNVKTVLIDKCLEPVASIEDANIQLCKVIITPQCDVCQKKVIKHRMICGLLFLYGKANPRKGDDMFTFAPFVYNNLKYALVFNYQTMSSIDDESIKAQQPLFGLRQDLVFDMQSKAANHINRLGNFVIKATFNKSML